MQRSRTRSRSPRRRYDDRDRSRSRDRYRRDRRDRSPANGNNYDNRAPPTTRGNYENKEQMLSNIKESSQQERRVYVGNLSYDVKW